MVVIAQSFYHPWRATVDGRPVRIWPANFGFQALEVPAGRHEVRLDYVDRLFNYGALAGFVALIALAVIWFFTRVAPHDGAGEAPG
jgi:uncharacterized membrane protein YfhO